MMDQLKIHQISAHKRGGKHACKYALIHTPVFLSHCLLFPPSIYECTSTPQQPRLHDCTFLTSHKQCTAGLQIYLFINITNSMNLILIINSNSYTVLLTILVYSAFLFHFFRLTDQLSASILKDAFCIQFSRPVMD